MILIRPHSIGKIMTEPRIKADKESGNLSETAKSYLFGLSKEIVYGYRATITSKYMEKGFRCEQDSIDLYNSVFFTMHQKNSERRSNEVMSGEPDIVDDDLIIDIKTSWSLETFPATSDQVHDDNYEWQGRAYMHLFDKPRFELAFCMVSTPEDLCKYESPDVHFVEHIDPALRVSTAIYERDMEKEERMIERCKKAQQYVTGIVERIYKEARTRGYK